MKNKIFFFILLVLILNLSGEVTRLIEVNIPVLGPQLKYGIKKVIFITNYSYPESEIYFTCKPYRVNKVPEKIQDWVTEDLNLASRAGLKIDEVKITKNGEKNKIVLDATDLKSVEGIKKEEILRLTLTALKRNLEEQEIEECKISFKGKEKHSELNWDEFEISSIWHIEEKEIYVEEVKDELTLSKMKTLFLKEIEYKEKKEGVYEPKEAKINFEEDLDGDGKKEKVMVAFEKDYDFTIYVNGKKLLSDYIDGRINYISVVDINEKDKFKEIEIFSEGPSDDYISRYYHYEKGKIIFMGELSCVRGTENGYIYTDDWKGSWSVIQKFYVDEKFKIQEIKQPFYWVGLRVKAKEEFPIYFSPDNKSQIIEKVKKNEKVSILCEKEEWLIVKTIRGIVGWVNLGNFPCEIPCAD